MSPPDYSRLGFVAATAPPSAAPAAPTARVEAEGRRSHGRLLHWALVCAFFFVLAVVQTWPLLLHMDSRVAGWGPDLEAHLWSLWWVKESVLSLQDPFRSDLIFYPQGADLYLHTLAPVNGLLSIPLQWATGDVVTSWNVLSLMSLTASGVGAYALARLVSGDRWAALAGGVIFAFNPWTMMQLHAHFNIFATWPVPLFVIFVLMYAESPKLKYALAAGAMWAVMLWNWQEFAIDSALFLGLFVAYFGAIYLLRGRREQALGLARGAAVAAIIAGLVSLPYLIPSVYQVATGRVSMSGALSPVAEFYSADLLSLVTPSPLWGPGQMPKPDVGWPVPIGSFETTVYLGILPLLLALAATALWWRKRRTLVGFWLAVFAFFAVMALGPFLYVNGDKTFEVAGQELTLTLPFRLFKELPLVGLRRVPARMVMFAYLALAVLAPLGLAALRERVPGRLRRAYPALALAAAALITLEFWNPPVHTTRFQLPPVYEAIAAERGDFAVLELPLGRVTMTAQRGDIVSAGMADYSQIVHGKATFGGYISRGRDEDVAWLGEAPGFAYLSCPACPDVPRSVDLDRASVRDYFDRLRVKYAVLNLEDWEGVPTRLATEGTASAVEEYVEDVLGFQEIERDETHVAYRNPRLD